MYTINIPNSAEVQGFHKDACPTCGQMPPAKGLNCVFCGPANTPEEYQAVMARVAEERAAKK